jgi:putative SOS response-associated peptidase YedK
VDDISKQPYATALNEGPLFAFAALWETWKDKETGKALENYTIVTTDPNELMTTIHNRMPVILKPPDYRRWLEPGDPQCPPVNLLRPFPAEDMKAWKFGRDMGNTRINRTDLLQPIDAEMA